MKTALTRKEFIRLAVTFIGAGTVAPALFAGCGEGVTSTGGDLASASPDLVTTGSSDLATGSSDLATGSTDLAGPSADLSSANPTCGLNGAKHATISGNHGHALVIPAAHFATVMARSYDIEGGAGHLHSVALTAMQFGVLATGGTVTVSSTGGDHSHTVAVTCA